MEKVKAAVQAGVSLGAAVRDVLPPGRSISAIALAYGIPRRDLSLVLNGWLEPSDKMLHALRTEIGGTRADWYALLDAERQRRRQTTVATVGA